MSHVDVCVVGSANLDLVARVERLPRPGETLLGSSYFEAPGGKGLNQAVAAARSGARTAFVARVGRDAAGETLLGVMADEDIDARAVDLCDASTGRAMITVGADGENSIVVVPGANAELDAGALRLHGSTIAGAAVLLVQLEVPIDTVGDALTVGHAVGVTTILNPAPAQPLSRDLLRLVDILVPNEHEAELLGGPAALLAAGVGAVVVTEGARGARLVTSGNELRIAPLTVTPIDATAAGDSFCGSLAARLASGHQLVDALAWACAAGALATTRAGAVPSIPTAAAIEVALTSAT